MAVDVEKLFAQWGTAWMTRDAATRRAALEACTTEDVLFTPPDDSRRIARGRTALDEHIATYTAHWPDGVTVDLAGPPVTHHDWSRAFVRWTFPSMQAVGLDIIRIENERIAAMLVFTESPAVENGHPS